ncbi:unnamed protein product [Caenorhabditis nigoni]
MPLRFLGRKNSDRTRQKKKSVHPSQVIPKGHPSKDIQCKMSGVADLTEFILTTSILRPNSPIVKFKDIVFQIPMASTLRKKCEMAIAFREGRLTDILAVGKSLMGDEKFKAFAQRLTIENLKTANSGLPAAPFMAMEFSTRTKMNGKTRMGEEKKVAEKKCE